MRGKVCITSDNSPNSSADYSSASAPGKPKHVCRELSTSKGGEGYAAPVIGKAMSCRFPAPLKRRTGSDLPYADDYEMAPT